MKELKINSIWRNPTEYFEFCIEESKSAGELIFGAEANKRKKLRDQAMLPKFRPNGRRNKKV